MFLIGSYATDEHLPTEAAVAVRVNCCSAAASHRRKLMTELPLSSSLFVISTEPATAKSRVNEQMGIKISPQRHPKH